MYYTIVIQGKTYAVKILHSEMWADLHRYLSIVYYEGDTKLWDEF